MQLRDRYDEVLGLGAELAAVGTGGGRYAESFVEDHAIPFPVLCDVDGAAARAASVERAAPHRLFHPSSFAPTLRAWRAGHRIRIAGRRVTQLGATFVVGPGPRLHYAHRDMHPADHAPLDAVFAALRA